MASVGLFTHNSTLLKMKQVEFINIINTHCPVFFHTEYLLQALIASSNENEDIAIVRKCMYNHLYRLEKQHLVKRLSPKRNRNALYEQQFSLQSSPQQPPLKMVNPLGKQSHKQDQLKNHYNALQQHIKQLKQKHNDHSHDDKHNYSIIAWNDMSLYYVWPDMTQCFLHGN